MRRRPPSLSLFPYTTLFRSTTIRDLGTEGAGYGDVGMRQAIEEQIVPGPRVLAVTRAIVATGSYGPKIAPEGAVPLGAEERSEEHTSELQSLRHLVCRLLLE